MGTAIVLVAVPARVWRQCMDFTLYAGDAGGYMLQGDHRNTEHAAAEWR